MNKQQEVRFGSSLVTPCSLGVACRPSVVVTLSQVSHRAQSEGLAAEPQLRMKSSFLEIASILLV